MCFGGVTKPQTWNLSPSKVDFCTHQRPRGTTRAVTLAVKTGFPPNKGEVMKFTKIKLRRMCFFLGSLHLTRDWRKTGGISFINTGMCVKTLPLRGFCTTNLYCFAEFLLKSIIHHTRKRLEEVSVSSSWRFGRFLWQEEYICVHLFVKLAVVRWLIGGLGKHQIKLDLIFTQTTFLFRRPKGFFARKS